jgi:hypothetical protein
MAYDPTKRNDIALVLAIGRVLLYPFKFFGQCIYKIIGKRRLPKEKDLR